MLRPLLHVIVRSAALALVVAGCGTVTEEIVIDSEFRPGVTITCTGDLRISSQTCRAWGDDILAGPIPPQDVTEMTLTVRGRDSRCSADFYTGAGHRVEATAAIPCP